ncbi:hypothetical protein GCM10009639_18780 [Kitasatospora putterlickiae]|uniref:Uncharacterized protein n=1 Tax=Kitasatospora putterlickiae TaxID=221725 RepID=A0ABP4IGY4_9ACTN
MADVDISTGELNASANLASTLAQEFASPVQTALTSATTTSGQLAGWSIAGGLRQLGNGWAAPLGALRQRLTDTAANLHANATSHANNEQAVAGAWSAPQGAK